MDTQTQIERLIELAIIQRTELKQLVDQLPQLREHLNAEVERTFEEVEPQLRVELEEFVSKQASEKATALSSALEDKVAALAKTLQDSAQAKFSALMAAREQNADLLEKAEQKIAEAAAQIPSNVKEIVAAELARFPRAGEIDQLRKEFAEPRGLNPRGKWSSSETYNRLDLVSFNGDSFVSSIDGNKEKPNRSGGSWTLSAARGAYGGGGGITSLVDLYNKPDAGQILIGTGNDYVNANLTAGTGITITNSAGGIQIDTTGTQTSTTLSAQVVNAESVAITRGQVVYAYGATGNRMSVKLASNSSEATSSKTIGIVSDASIAAGATGTITQVGEVSNLNLGSYTAGDTVYLDSTAGGFTATKPSAPNHLVYVGIVERANNGNGLLYVKIQNGYELEELHNVAISSPTTGQTIVYNSATGLWNNSNAVTVSGGSVNGSPIGASSASTGAFTTLSASGNLTVSGGTIQNSTTNLLIDATAGSTQTKKVYVKGGDLSNNTSAFEVQGFGGASLLDVKGAGNATLAGNLTVSGGSIIGGTSLTLSGGTGDIAFSTSGIIQVPNGVPIRCSQTNNTGGIYFDSANFEFRNPAAGYATALKLANNGNLLIGTTADSSNGKLQFATHTTSAGGIGFGTDTALFRQAGGVLALDGTTSNFRLLQAGTIIAQFNASGNQLYIDNIYGAGGNIFFRTGSGPTSALALDSSQNATFTGTVKIKNQATLNANGTVSVGTTATTIFSALNTGSANWCWVFGDDGSSGFADFVVTVGSGGAVTVISSATVYGSPPARTYTSSAANLRLALASGSLAVRTTSLNAGT